MTVTKADYLRNKILVEGMRGLVGQLAENREMANSALAHSMGLSWRSAIRPDQGAPGFEAVDRHLEGLVADTYRLNPDWRQLRVALDIADAQVREEKTDGGPRLAAFGRLHGAITPYDGGFSSKQNLNGWEVGLGLEVPLFRGGLSRARVAEAKARLAEMESQQILLREGLALQVKVLVQQLSGMQGRMGSARSAIDSAQEYSELAMKGFRHGMMEADDAFQGRIVEAFTRVREAKLKHDHTVARLKLDHVVGREMLGALGLGE